VLPILARFPLTLHNPDVARARALRLTEGVYQRYAAQAAAAQTFKQRLAFMRSTLFEIPAFAFLNLIPVFAPGYMMFAMLGELIKGLPDADRLLLEVTRGLPHNVTTEMDLALWRTARTIKADLTSAEHYNGHTAPELAAEYLGGRLPEAAQQAVKIFLDQYGVRGVAEIDSGRPRWREDPTPVMQSLLSYMQIEDEERAPDAVFARSAQQAEAAIEKLITELRNGRHGWLKARLGRAIVRRVRALAGMREFPKFFVVRMIWLVRQSMLQTGQSLVVAGACNRADDVYFLFYDELAELEKFETPDGHWNVGDELKALMQRARARRNIYDREKMRRQTPRILMSDGRAFYGQVAESDAGGDSLSGSPVSPGVVEGEVRVVLDPHHTRLAPGEILVCPGTDPAWTPLFLAAGGLIMEVGGLMTHGAVVAREYGIPAVVGVHQVTHKLQNGQRVRVDGNTGKVTLL
jgi:pyruvate,water dikinase